MNQAVSLIRLLDFCSRLLDDLPPLRYFGLEESRELLGCGADRFCSHNSKAIHHVGNLEGSDAFLVEFRDDLFRCTGRRQQSLPVVDFESGIPRLGDGRQVWKLSQTPRSCNPQHPQLAHLHERHSGWGRQQSHVYLPAQHGRRGRADSAEWHVNSVEACLQLEHLHSQMCALAGTGRRVGELTLS